MKNLYTKVLLWLLVFVSITGCSLAFDDIETKGSFTPEIAIPLLETQYRLGDLMKGLGANDYLQIRPDGQLEMQFKGSFSDAQTLNVLSSLPTVTIPAPNPIIFVPFPNPSGMKIESMDLKKGIFKWTMTNNNTAAATVTVTFFSLTKNSAPFEQTFSMFQGQTISLGMDMNGWKLEANALGNISIGYKAIVGGGESRLSDVSYEISGMDAKKVVGYFGRSSLSLKRQDLAFDFFKKWSQSGDIRFSDPSLSITVDNGFGFPVSIKSQMAEITKKDGSKLGITGELSTGVVLNYPNFTEMGKTKQTIINLTKQNSNIVDVINAYPTSVALVLNVLTNPDSTNKQSGFVLDDRGIKFKIDANIPLIAAAKNFVFLDTLDINFSDFSDIRSAEFKVITDNTLPVDIGMQVYFMTSSYGLIDSLTTGSQALILKSANTFNGQVVSMSSNTTVVNMDDLRFSHIKSARKIVVKSILSTALDGSVPVFLKADQKFLMRIGLRAKAKI